MTNGWISVVLEIVWGVATKVFGLLFQDMIATGISRAIELIVPGEVRGWWSTKFWKEEKYFREKARLDKLSDRVWGTIEYPAKGRKYRFKGTLCNGILVATYQLPWPARRETVDRGSFTLRLHPGGKPRKMTGCYAWTDDNSLNPKGDHYEWRKQG